MDRRRNYIFLVEIQHDISCQVNSIGIHSIGYYLVTNSLHSLSCLANNDGSLFLMYKSRDKTNKLSCVLSLEQR